jgi:hypothetical protein
MVGDLKTRSPERYAKLMGQLRQAYTDLRHSAWVQKALTRVNPADMDNEAVVLEELAAYAIEEYSKKPSSLPQQFLRWVHDVVASVRVLVKNTLGIELGTFGPAEYAAMARWYLRESIGYQRLMDILAYVSPPPDGPKGGQPKAAVSSPTEADRIRRQNNWSSSNPWPAVQGFDPKNSWHRALANATNAGWTTPPTISTPAVLRRPGFSAGTKMLEISRRIMEKIGVKHGEITPQDILDLPELLADPLFIYPNARGQLRVVVDRLDAQNRPIVVGIGDRGVRTIFALEDGAEQLAEELRAALSTNGLDVYAKNVNTLAEAKVFDVDATPAAGLNSPMRQTASPDRLAGDAGTSSVHSSLQASSISEDAAPRIAPEDYILSRLMPRVKANLHGETGFLFSERKGHAQPLDAKVLTPSGFVRMGDVRVGDTVTTPGGATAHVTDIFPQGKKPVFYVTLSDGSKTKATADHLWAVLREGVEQVMSTAEIMKGLERGVRFAVPHV